MVFSIYHELKCKSDNTQFIILSALACSFRGRYLVSFLIVDFKFVKQKSYNPPAMWIGRGCVFVCVCVCLCVFVCIVCVVCSP